MGRRAVVFLLAVLLAGPACGIVSGSSDDETLTVYSGRSEDLVGTLLERFEKESGIDLKVKYAGTPELANQILEEGGNSPADVFFAQDAGSLGAVAKEGRFLRLDEGILDLVPARVRSKDGDWIGVSGRVRVLAYNPERTKEQDLPASVLDLVDPKWKDRVAWAPTNASFQSFLSAMRLLKGEDVARRWVEEMVANRAGAFPNNITVIQAVGRGEFDVGLVNNYYLHEMKKQDPGLKAANHFFTGGDIGGLVNVAGLGVLETTKKREQAAELIRFLLSEESQRFFAEETYEYPLIAGVAPASDQPPLDSLQAPEIDLSDLSDLPGTQKLLADAGVL
ncbi:MAG TPA: iron ABC transporter substrate-binding protein [Acidimicrobiia bacterium]|nr:iron ABC transporter substrate-binding protein [Acidimicrobiia bacterium]